MQTSKSIALVGAMGVLVWTVISQVAPLGASLLVAKQTVTICHQGTTTEVMPNALSGHLDHGDTLDACSSSSSSSVSSDSSSSADTLVTLCHNGTTTDVPSNAVDGHLGHGDTLGECPIASSSSSSQTPSSGDQSGGQEHGKNEVLAAVVPGRGLGEQAAVLRAVFAINGLVKTDSEPHIFQYQQSDIHPSDLTTSQSNDWENREHQAICSMYVYLSRLHDLRPATRPGYIDWLANQIAIALEEDPLDVKAALLGDVHSHAHGSSSFLEEGCATQKNGLGGVEQPAIAVESNDTHEEHDMMSSSGETLTLRPESLTGEIAFSIMNGDQLVTDLQVSHEKKVHVMVVRDDLRHFAHIHPELDEVTGIWHVPFTPEAGGNYWIFADFVDAQGIGHTLRMDQAMDGDVGEYGVVPDYSTQKNVGPFVVQFYPEEYSKGMIISVHVHREWSMSDVPIFENYLGSLGHGILVSPDGSMIHTHPSLADHNLDFHTPALTNKLYRAFMQFQVQGVIYTATFDYISEER